MSKQVSSEKTKGAKQTSRVFHLCTQVSNTTAEFGKYMLDKHPLQLRFIWIRLLQFITQCPNSKKSTIFLAIRLKISRCLIIPVQQRSIRKQMWLLVTRQMMVHTYLLNISTMKWMNFWRLVFPRFLTNSLTKSIAAVRGLYKSSIISLNMKSSIVSNLITI